MNAPTARKPKPSKPDDAFAYEPPESLIIAERAVITYAMTLDGFFKLPEVATLSPLSFWNDAYGQTYAIALGAHRRGDPVTHHVAARLADGTVTGVDFEHVKKLMREAGTGYDAGYHVGEVLKQARIRRAIATSKHLLDEAKRGNVDAEHIAGMVQPLVTEPKQRRMPTVVSATPQPTKKREPVIYGLLRQGETMNIVAAPKTGKSWLGLHLAFAVATGTHFLEEFGTVRGRVLILDNELYDLPDRIELVRQRYGYDIEAGYVSHYELRGEGVKINQLDDLILSNGPNHYSLVICDALYRMIPDGIEENSNDGMTRLYNEVDRLAKVSGAAFVLIHHTSKGNQSGKSVSDAGSGAGAQSRAADTHLVLRQHEEADHVVLDAVTRSWKSPAPRVYHIDPPLWTPAIDRDPTQLKREGKPRQKDNPLAPRKKADDWSFQRFAREIVGSEPKLKNAITAEALSAGLSAAKTKLFLDAAKGAGILIETRGKRHNDPYTYRYSPPESEDRWYQETDTPNPPHRECGDLEGGTGGENTPHLTNGGVKRESLFDQHNSSIGEEFPE